MYYEEGETFTPKLLHAQPLIERCSRIQTHKSIEEKVSSSDMEEWRFAQSRS